MDQANAPARHSWVILPSLLLLLFLPAFFPSISFSSDSSDLGPGYAGDAACRKCHEEDQHGFDQTVHSRVFSAENARTPLMKIGCEACHGPGKVHAESKDDDGSNLIRFVRETPEGIERENNACLACHTKRDHLYWDGGAHQSEDLSCTNCHTLMEKHSQHALLKKPTVLETCGQCHRMRIAQTWRNAHMPLREGQMNCASCHNPHGTAYKANLADFGPNETCYRCHADKRGPFLWEHVPSTESCMTCHDPHGTVRPRMLKLLVPRLCQQCHIETRHPTEARLPTNKFVIGSACLQCHKNIHGSNHPAGFAFTR